MMVHFGLSFALYCQRRYDEAIENAARAVELYPDYWLVHFGMGLAQAQQGSLQASIASLEKTLQLAPSSILATAFLAASYLRSGNPGCAEQLMDVVRQRGSKQYVSPFCFAVYNAALGNADAMFECLQAALGDHDPYLSRMDAEPYFDPFRSDPRYRDLMGRMNLA
jgi:tetratricopeptide (TPR) repeat protein